jgi:apolipoprotein N-acyltransferase
VKFIFRKSDLTKEEKEYRLKEWMLLISSGVLLGLAYPPFPFPFQFLFFIGFIPYFYVIEKRETYGGINRATYLTFFIFSVVTLYWVGSWQHKTDPFLMISGVLLLFVNPIFMLIPSSLFYFARKIINRKTALYLFPVFWITYEYLYMVTDASFPWLTVGSGLSYFISFIQIADIVSAVGLSLIVIYINIFLYLSVKDFKISKARSSAYAGAAFLIFALVLLYGIVRLSSFELSDKKIRAGIIQPDLDPWDKWSDKPISSLTEIYFDLSRKAVEQGAKLLVWPETALPVYLLGGSYESTVREIHHFINEHDVVLLTGMPDIIYYGENDEKPYDVKYSEYLGYYATFNGIILFEPGVDTVQRYGKMKLVPFGERVPFVDQLPFLGDLIKWGVGLSGWNVGQDTVVFRSTALKENYELNINGLVCYESIYPFFVAEFVKKGADILAVVTNDSWYGNLSGPYQHKEIAVLRAVETRKSVVRAANGGISAIINPLGITQVETKMLTKDFIVDDVIIQQDETIFTKTSLVIPSVAAAVSFWIFAFFLFKRLKNKLKKYK